LIGLFLTGHSAQKDQTILTTCLLFTI